MKLPQVCLHLACLFLYIPMEKPGKDWGTQKRLGYREILLLKGQDSAKQVFGGRSTRKVGWRSALWRKAQTTARQEESVRCGYLGRDTAEGLENGDWGHLEFLVPGSSFPGKLWKRDQQRDPRPQWPTTTSESFKQGGGPECGQKKMGAFWT